MCSSIIILDFFININFVCSCISKVVSGHCFLLSDSYIYVCFLTTVTEEFSFWGITPCSQGKSRDVLEELIASIFMVEI
jgi:hypothetical protein